jgi:hypothetical protein
VRDDEKQLPAAAKTRVVENGRQLPRSTATRRQAWEPTAQEETATVKLNIHKMQTFVDKTKLSGSFVRSSKKPCRNEQNLRLLVRLLTEAQQ